MAQGPDPGPLPRVLDEDIERRVDRRVARAYARRLGVFSLLLAVLSPAPAWFDLTYGGGAPAVAVGLRAGLATLAGVIGWQLVARLPAGAVLIWIDALLLGAVGGALGYLAAQGRGADGLVLIQINLAALLVLFALRSGLVRGPALAGAPVLLLAGGLFFAAARFAGAPPGLLAAGPDLFLAAALFGIVGAGLDWLAARRIALPAIDRYRLEGVLAVGGFAVVYDAIDTRAGAPCAVKVQLQGDAHDARSEAQFHATIRAAIGTIHPNVVATLDHGFTTAGHAFVVMDRLVGRDLAAELGARGPLPVDEALELTAQASRALEALHAQGLVHGDVKPENLFLTEDGVLKLIDFGVVEPRPADPSRIVGTADFVAPERARGGPGDARSDVYSLGAVLFALLTGRTLFAGPDDSVVAQQVQRLAPRPSELRAGLPSAVDDLVVRALEKDPERRPRDMRSLRGALDSALEIVRA